MKITFDLRSALVGLIAGVLVTFALGAATVAPKQVGRYQVAAGAGHGLLVDTATGQVWTVNLAFDRLTSNTDFKQPKQPQ